MTSHDSAPCILDLRGAERLQELNDAPLPFLAGCGVRHGEPFGLALLHARLVLNEWRMPGRHFDLVDGVQLCFAMRALAEATGIHVQAADPAVLQ